jgi:ribonuclease HI
VVSRKYKIEKLGIFMSDASFDIKNGVSSIAIINLKTQDTKSIQKISKSVFQAEYEGILESLKLADGKYSNVIVFCDSKDAVNEINLKLANTGYFNSKFNSIQIVWLNREETFIADFFTKNVSDPKKNMELKIEAYKNSCKTSNVMDIFLTKRNKQKILINLFKEAFKEYPLLKIFEFKSDYLKKIIFENNFRDKTDTDVNDMKEDCQSIYELSPIILSKDSKFFAAIQGVLTL